jgi:hypothetical protein
VKIVAYSITAKDNECYNFICGSYMKSVHALYFGGRPVGIQLKEEKISYFLWNKLEKSGRYKSLTTLYYDP